MNLSATVKHVDIVKAAVQVADQIHNTTHSTSARGTPWALRHDSPPDYALPVAGVVHLVAAAKSSSPFTNRRPVLLLGGSVYMPEFV